MLSRQHSLNPVKDKSLGQELLIERNLKFANFDQLGLTSWFVLDEQTSLSTVLTMACIQSTAARIQEIKLVKI